jgi:hypothetical protein
MPPTATAQPAAKATAPPAASAPPGAPSRVLAQIAALQRMDAGELRKQWEALMGSTPAQGSALSLRQRLIHRVQELAYGGLSPATQAALARVAKRDAKEPGCPTERVPVPGMRFRREWRGQWHEVTALPDGFEYQGKPYRSLTAVAKAITGQHTNGKLFFGTKKRERGES